MKSKKLLFSTFLSLSCIATYLIFTSSATAVQGVMGASTIGCGSCHGTANAATTITVTGIPATGFIAGTTYPLSLKVTNASKLAAGFDLSVTAGTLSNPPANTMLMGGGTELHHTAKLLMTAGDAVWNFSWTAPAAGNTATIHVAGNAVNNNGSDSGDQWNKISITFNKAIPAAVTDMEKTGISVFPNPCTDYITVNSTQEIDLNTFYAVSFNGSIIKMSAMKMNPDNYKLETTSLSKGNYLLAYSVNGKTNHVRFSKSE